MSLAWVAEQIRAVREASGELGPNLIRFNPNPPGMVRPGSATDAVLAHLRAGAGPGETHHGARQPLDGAGEIRRRTAVDPPARDGLAGLGLKGIAHGALNRMIQFDIFRPAAKMPVQRQKTRMLAGFLWCSLLQ